MKQNVAESLEKEELGKVKKTYLVTSELVLVSIPMYTTTYCRTGSAEWFSIFLKRRLRHTVKCNVGE